MCWDYFPVSFESGSEVYLPVCVLEREGRVYTRLSLCAEYPVLIPQFLEHCSLWVCIDSPLGDVC